MSLAPLAYRIRKRLSLDGTLARAARETVIVAEAESGIRSKAAYLPGQLDRVKDVQPETTHQLEMERISATPVHHAATMAYRLKNCALVGGTLYCGGVGHQMLKDRPPLVGAVDAEIGHAALVGTPVSDIYFGHFLCDDSATVLLAQNFAPAYRPASRHHAGWSHPADYHKMMGIKLTDTGNARIKDAWIFQDIGMTGNRRQRFRTLRQRLHDLPAAREGHGVFLVRGRSGHQRILRNENEIAEGLASRGFEIVDPERETAEEIVRKLSGARVAIGVEGSGMAHAFLTLADGGAMMTIQPPHRFNNIYKEFTDMMGMGYGFVVAEGDRHCFEADLDDLLRTVDLLT
ncbi:DUF563 domain-containing protein [Paracoccus sp. YIM 132242]|uniref:DUF563 domain-containing protein n=1 Tax=Paracoccus lichenicola TaxID=2665644 RepID=A0A6L6HPB3_9RHOB|nr:glycosyltransferase family 61 protein [Paracoccus lichenicola]MTE00966.1 DUF563 domain-containing protein [Paracoccus lichenicola]